MTKTQIFFEMKITLCETNTCTGQWAYLFNDSKTDSPIGIICDLM